MGELTLVFSLLKVGVLKGSKDSVLLPSETKDSSLKTNARVLELGARGCQKFDFWSSKEEAVDTQDF